MIEPDTQAAPSAEDVAELLRQLQTDPQQLSSAQTAQLRQALESYAVQHQEGERKPLLFTRIAMTLAGGGSLGLITALLAPSLLFPAVTALAGGAAVWLAAERIGSEQPRHNGA
jgi:fatty acid desaturase